MKKQNRKKAIKTRPATAVGLKGKQQVKDILANARQLLTEEGYEEFSVRAVADRCGLAQAGLQYYFPTRVNLIHALVQDVYNRYEEKHHKRFDKLPDEPRQRFISYVDFLLNDIHNRKTRRFFIQLWALLHSTGIPVKILKELYKHQLAFISALLMDLKPELTNATANDRAAMIAAMLEGMIISLPVTQSSKPGSRNNFDHNIREMLLKIAIT